MEPTFVRHRVQVSQEDAVAYMDYTCTPLRTPLAPVRPGKHVTGSVRHGVHEVQVYAAAYMLLHVHGGTTLGARYRGHRVPWLYAAAYTTDHVRRCVRQHLCAQLRTHRTHNQGLGSYQ